MPARMFKGFTSQGGIRVPAFTHYPKGIEKGVRSDKLLHVLDVMPTLMKFAGISHPGSRYRDKEVVDMKGHSMLSLLQGKTDSVHADDYVIGWELFSKHAVRKGDWKILFEIFYEVLEPRAAGIKTDTGQLYNLEMIQQNNMTFLRRTRKNWPR
jgi:arylsulfatase A-like enzyme